jgi:hypothetical protein
MYDESKRLKLYIQAKHEIQNNLGYEEHTTRSPYIYSIFVNLTTTLTLL